MRGARGGNRRRTGRAATADDQYIGCNCSAGFKHIGSFLITIRFRLD